MEEILSDVSLHAVFSAGNGEVEIYEVTVSELWHGRTVGDLVVNGNCAAVALTRSSRAMLPGPDMRLEAGDIIHLSATQEGIEALRKRLGLSKKA
jgi:trk system potassium uptake protein TrkA